MTMDDHEAICLATLLSTVGGMLRELQDKSITMQASIHAQMSESQDLRQVLIGLQSLDFQTQVQGDLASVLLAAAEEISPREVKIKSLANVCILQSTTDRLEGNGSRINFSKDESGIPTFF